MTVSPKDTEYVANLARLGLSEEEKSLFTGQLNDILGYIDVINGVDTSHISSTANNSVSGTRLRADIAIPFADTQSILSNAPKEEDNMFRVPKILVSEE